MFLALLSSGCLLISDEELAGRLADLDQDGFVGSAHGGADCDDEDPAVHPLADEICGDGADGDCDGDPEDCRLGPATTLADADAELFSEVPGEAAGSIVVMAGDVDDDGYGDVLVGAVYSDERGEHAGLVYLVRGPLEGSRGLGTATARFLGEEAGALAGMAAEGAGDVNGDGRADLLVGSPGVNAGGEQAGAAYVLYGPQEGDIDLASADARILGDLPWDAIGYDLAAAGDLDGDGLADVIVGAGVADVDGLEDSGAACVFSGPVVGEHRLSEAAACLAGPVSFARAGGNVSGPGDVDGDGFDDLWVAGMNMPREPGGELGVGAAWLVYGPVAGRIDPADADAVLYGEAVGDSFGTDLAGAGDVDKDGYADLLALSWGADRGGTNAGAAYLVRGPLHGEAEAADADVVWSGSAESPLHPQVRPAGDLDADGWPDVVISSGRDRQGGTDAGAAFVFYGPLLQRGEPRTLLGVAPGDLAGWSVEGRQDVDGDGVDDLLVGGWGVGEEAGAAWLVLGESR
ncbi:MAG: integrin alpha [Pseudomonadota bacterium]|nr:integrin alpha [Pseudomonadota bacterium]